MLSCIITFFIGIGHNRESCYGAAFAAAINKYVPLIYMFLYITTVAFDMKDEITHNSTHKQLQNVYKMHISQVVTWEGFNYKASWIIQM